MKGKPYIDCALEAAFAAKNHGFSFIDGGTNVEFGITKATYKNRAFDDYSCFFDGGWDGSTTLWKRRYYIGAESLILINPVEGDIGKLNDGSVGIFGKPFIEKWCRDGVLYLPSEGEIIQRNNKPFPAIQYDE